MPPTSAAGCSTSAGNSDVFVARFGSGGSHAWSRRFGDADIQVATGVAVDPAGNVAVAGTFQGSVDFGGGALTSAGQYDLFLAKLEPAGTHLWSRRFGDAQPQVAVAVAVDALGDVFLAGGLVGSVDFGGGSRTSAGSSDVFAARFDAAGSHLWSARFGDAGYQGAEAIAVDAAGNAVITGALQSSANFGGGDSAGAGGDDLFVARFATDGAHRWSRCPAMPCNRSASASRWPRPATWPSPVSSKARSTSAADRWRVRGGSDAFLSSCWHREDGLATGNERKMTARIAGMLRSFDFGGGGAHSIQGSS